MNDLYQHMKARGLDMSWYEKARPITNPDPEPLALQENECSRLSIYLIEPNGTISTVTGSGQKYMTVKYTEARPRNAIYACSNCKQQWVTFEEALKHYRVRAA